LIEMNIVSSEHLRQWMVERGAEPGRISVCYTNIDTNEWKPVQLDDRNQLRRELSIDENFPIILYAGRIHPQKQPRVFAATMLQLRDAGSRFIALVAGDGPELPWLQNFVREHSLQSYVKLLGAISNDRMKGILPACDILFLPSQMEGISLAIYEAMACGVAVVAADVGGQNELLTQDCGILIERGSENDETEKYRAALLALIRDPKRMRAMGEAGRKRIIEEFELHNMGTRMHELLLQAARLNKFEPRLPVNRGVARSSLAMAVDYTRIEKVLQSVSQQHRADRRRKQRLMEEGIYDFFAHLPEPVLHAFLGDGIPHEPSPLADVLLMRERILPRIAAWECEASRVYIYGLGTHTQVLLGTLPMLMPLVRGFVDQRGEGFFLGLPCIKPEAIGPEMADVIIYSSKRWEADMYRNLAHLTSIEHVRIYSDLCRPVHIPQTSRQDCSVVARSI